MGKCLKTLKIRHHLSRELLVLSNEEMSRIQKEMRDLKGRIKKTRKSRIEASKRLRKKHNYYEKVTHFYSLIVLILSVWFFNIEGDSGVLAAKILLVLSLSLTYFTMFLSMRNYKERASSFETNYQQLDVLVNSIDRFEASGDDLNEGVLKGFQREYEKLIIGKENHLNIDFYNSDNEIHHKFKSEILIYNIKEKSIKALVAIYPLLLILLIYFFSKIVNFINNV
jgi:hypothetical protein